MFLSLSLFQELVKTLNEAILSVKMNVSVLNVSLDLSTSPFPNKFRISQLDVVGQYGGVWFFLPPVRCFSVRFWIHYLIDFVSSR